MGIGLAVLLAESDVEQTFAVGNDGAVSALEIGNAFAFAAWLKSIKRIVDCKLIYRQN